MTLISIATLAVALDVLYLLYLTFKTIRTLRSKVMKLPNMEGERKEHYKVNATFSYLHRQEHIVNH